jgi:hypothetical protein
MLEKKSPLIVHTNRLYQGTKRLFKFKTAGVYHKSHVPINLFPSSKQPPSCRHKIRTRSSIRYPCRSPTSRGLDRYCQSRRSHTGRKRFRRVVRTRAPIKLQIPNISLAKHLCLTTEVTCSRWTLEMAASSTAIKVFIPLPVFETKTWKLTRYLRINNLTGSNNGWFGFYFLGQIL